MISSAGLKPEMSLRADSLIKLEDNRGWSDSITGFSTAAFNEYKSRQQRKYNPLVTRTREIFPALQSDRSELYYENDKLPGKEGRSRILVVFIHGLNSSPLAWSNYFSDFPLDNPEISCFVPFVYKKCYCKLKEAALPILRIVQSYADQYPANPIFLIGHSFGAGIAAYIEQKLNARFIRLISIAGPHCGTQLVNRMSLMRLSNCLGITDEMTEELLYKGAFATKKLIKWQSSQENYEKHGKDVKRIFFASVDDWRIYPHETSFPNLPNSQYRLTHGESHVTIIDAVRTNVVRYFAEQMEELGAGR